MVKMLGKKWWELLTLLLVTVAVRHVNSQVRASFGESCGEGIRCDSRQSLTCSDNVCKCLKPREMTFDNEKKKCVVLSGERCSYTAVEILSDTTQEKRWTEKLDCISNAVCNNDGFCGCNSNFFETLGGICTPKFLAGGNCTNDNECRSDLHLTCDENGTCNCNKTEAIFDRQHDRCVAKAGINCRGKYTSCVSNSYCNSYGYGGRYSSYDNKCTCSSGYTKSQDGLCLSNFNMPCDITTSPCLEKFVCREGRCSCNFPKHQFYDNGKEQCVSFVQGPCFENLKNDEEAKSFECVDQAECVNSTGVYECSCKPGYIESIGRQCKLSFNESCTSSSNCDTASNLFCIDGRCKCGSSFESYDKINHRCEGLVGASCFTNVTSTFCVTGAYCRTYRDSSNNLGTCRCLSGYSMDKSRKCVKVIQEPKTIQSQTDDVKNTKEFLITSTTPGVTITLQDASSNEYDSDE